MILLNHDFYKDEEYEEAEVNYYTIINNTAKLCRELNKTDMLSSFVIFSYSLWNGFFSEDKKYFHSEEKRKCFLNNNGMSIMANYGVCLNNAAMFYDFLRALAYKSTIVEGYLPKNVKLNYYSQIGPKRLNKKNTLVENLRLSFIEFMSNRFMDANHD